MSEFNMAFQRESIKFLTALDKRLNWFYVKPKGHWTFYKKRLMNILEHDYYDDDLLNDYLYRLGKIANAYKDTYDIDSDDLEWDEQGKITNDDFLRQVDFLKETVWNIIEWKNPDIYKKQNFN